MPQGRVPNGFARTNQAVSDDESRLQTPPKRAIELQHERPCRASHWKDRERGWNAAPHPVGASLLSWLCAKFARGTSGEATADYDLLVVRNGMHGAHQDLCFTLGRRSTRRPRKGKRSSAMPTLSSAMIVVAAVTASANAMVGASTAPTVFVSLMQSAQYVGPSSHLHSSTNRREGRFTKMDEGGARSCNQCGVGESKAG